jgi:hypothetical protein
MKTKSAFVFFFSLVFLASAAVHAADWGFTPQTFDAKYGELNARYGELMKVIPKSLTKTGTSGFRNPVKLTPERAEMRKKFLELSEQKRIYDPIAELKEEYNAMYFRNPKTVADKAAVNEEAIRLASGLIDETERLKTKYKSFFIPIFHNMMIDVGVKKRGACKHWAEDLLSYLRKVDRKYFTVTWGEAHAKKFTEHNVAVVFPEYGRFDDGILFDPWRTSGKPFWVAVTADPHYHWTEWDQYGEY